MITITIIKNKSSDYIGFKCIGHAEFAEYGEDIVCASVSILVINTINSVEMLLKEPFRCIQDEEQGLIDFRFEQIPGRQAELLLNSMILGLTEVEKQYGKKYILLKFEEV